MFSRRFGIALFALAALLCTLLALPAFADSNVRIVRLSDMNGDVEIDRGAGQGFERALLNMPIVQGTKLWTRSGDARAEVELENGSTVRLAPGSQVTFAQLSRRDSGAMLSAVAVTEGTVYFNISRDKEDEFQAQFGRDQVSVPKSASFRIDMAKDQARLAVSKGDVEVQGPSSSVKVAKDKTATFDLTGDKSTLAKGVVPEPFDSWNKDESKYQQQYTSGGSPYRTPYNYGLSDLNYYGDYSYIAPYGWVWQPSGVGAAWNPFMSGAWSYYPGFGYSWVSTYPWGWLPYRYGAWAYIPGWGWGWQPSGYWGGFTNVPVIINAPAGFVAPAPPTGGTKTVVVTPPPVNHPGVNAGHPVPGKPGFVNDGAVDNKGRPLTATTVGPARTPVHGATATTVHGTTMIRGEAAPRPSMSAGSFGGSRSGGFGESGGMGRGGFGGHVGSSSSSGGHTSSGNSGGHSSSSPR